MVLVSSCLVHAAKKNDSGGMTNRTPDNEWARRAVRAAIARAMRALESEIAIEMGWVADAKKRLGITP
jgi:hypothetical protein